MAAPVKDKRSAQGSDSDGDFFDDTTGRQPQAGAMVAPDRRQIGLLARSHEMVAAMSQWFTFRQADQPRDPHNFLEVSGDKNNSILKSHGGVSNRSYVRGSGNSSNLSEGSATTTVVLGLLALAMGYLGWQLYSTK